MTNGIAIGMVVVLAGAVAADQAYWDGTAALFLARKGLDMIGWLAFWR